MAGNDAFVFGVDLDGVCGDFYGSLRPVVAEWLGVDEATLSDEFTHGLREWGVKDSDHYMSIHRFAVTQRQLFLKMVPMDGCGPVLRRLSEAGVYIRIVTHRLFISHFHREAINQTIEWLDSHGIPYRDLCFVKQKVEVGADLYIEDSPSNVQALVDSGKSVIVFTNPTNRHLSANLRAERWDQVEDMVHEQVRLGGKKLHSSEPDEPPPDEGPMYADGLPDQNDNA